MIGYSRKKKKKILLFHDIVYQIFVNDTEGGQSVTWGEMDSENAILRVAYLLNSPKGHALFHTIIFRFVHCSCLTRVLVRQLAKFY